MRTRTHGRSLAFTCSRRTIIGAAPSQIKLHISTVNGSAIGREAAISGGRKDLPVLGQRIQRAVVRRSMRRLLRSRGRFSAAGLLAARTAS